VCLIDNITNDLASIIVNVGMYSYKSRFWKMWKALFVGSFLQYGIYMSMRHDGNILQLALVQTFYDAEFVLYYVEMWP
jgi:hypothetical protein